MTLCHKARSTSRDAIPAQLQRSSATRRDRGPKGVPVHRRQLEQRAQPVAERLRIACREGDERRQRSGQRRFEVSGDLGEAGVQRDDRRAARGGSFGGHHAERLREDRGHHARVGEREEVAEVPVLERPREQRPQPVLDCMRLETGALRAEADDDDPRTESVERVEQDVDALLLDQLPEVDDRRGIPGEERGEPFGVPLVGQPLLAVAGVRRIVPGFCEERLESLRSLLGAPQVDVDSGRNLVDALDGAADLGEDGANVRRADEGGAGRCKRFGAPGAELRAAAHRVLELRPVRLHRIRRTGGQPDGPAEQHVVREHEVRGQAVAHRSRVRLHPCFEVVAGALVDEADVVPLVAVEHEHRQEPTDVGSDRRRRAEVVRLRPRLLAQNRDVVPCPAPFASELARVDVRARSSEEISVPEEDPQRLSVAPEALFASREVPRQHLRQMEVERVEELDGRVRRVHLHVAGLSISASE